MDVNAARVLVLDDTFTTGARAQSAASALALAGATPIAIVPGTRYVKPGWVASGALLKRAGALSYSFDYCCVGSHPLPAARG